MIHLPKFKKVQAIVLLMNILPLLGSAQIVSLPDSANLYTYLNYYFNSDNYNPNDSSEGGPLATHERLIQNWGSRLYPHGDFSVANKALINYAKNYTSIDTETEQANWINIGPSNGPVNSLANGVGQIHRISFDPQYGIGTNRTLYACSGHGGLWRTENDGGYWVNVNTDNLPITSVADIVIDPDNSNNLIIGTGLPDGGINLQYSSNWGNTNPIYTIGFYRSMDYGMTWSLIDTNFLNEFFEQGGTIRKLEINQFNGDTVFAATSTGVFRCLNAFEESPIWIKVFDGGDSALTKDFRCVKYKPGSALTLYASSDNIYQTNDGGSTWIPLTGEGTGMDLTTLGGHKLNIYRINLAVTEANPNKLFAYVMGDEKWSDAEKYFILVYDGNQWSQLYHESGKVTLDQNWIGLAVSPIDENKYFFYGTNPIGTGVNGISDQFNIPVPFSDYFSTPGMYADVHVLEFQPNITENPKLFCGHHAGISVGDISERYIWEFRNNNLANMLVWSFDNSEFLNNTFLTGNQDCFAYLKKGDQWRKIPDFGGDSYTARSSKNNDQYFYVTNNDPEGDNVMQYDLINDTTIMERDTLIPKDFIGYPNITKVPKTFQIVNFTNDNYDYFGFCEVYKRLFDKPIIGMTSEDLWEGDSDLGKTEPQIWARQITEMEYCLNFPNVIYLATGANFNHPYWGSSRPYLFKATNGGTNGNFQNASFDTIGFPGIGDELYPIISGIAVHPNNPDSVWITMIGYDNIDIRVALSIDGGETWQNADPCNSLPQLPVNGIVYQNGSNDILYIATDAGIYYKTNSMDHWEEYGDFPHVRVHELKIDYCSNKLRAATYGRSVWEADLIPGSIDQECFEIKAGESLTWDKPKALNSSIRIKSGGVLFIKNLVNMPKNGKIIVEQGGKLYIEGGALTNECGYTWKGIEVWGNNRQHQWPDSNNNYYQGFVSLKNAIIKNSICAVNLCNPTDAHGTGGIVVATNTDFINNTQSVHALNYRNFHPITHEEMDYQAHFKYCDFVLDTTYTSSETFYKHIDLASVKGVRFDACDFSLADETPNVSDYNHGIAAYSASFSVNPACDNVQPPCPEESYDSCTFTGFYNGITASIIDEGFMGFYVNRAHFNNNTHGINVNAINNFVVFKSTFEIGENKCDSIICSTPFGYGIYSSQANGFTIEENYFKRAVGVNSNYLTGIFIENSDNIDVVYKNTFDGLKIGNYGRFDNILQDDQFSGLSYLCNHNVNNYADFYTPARSEVEIYQGDRTLAAGNTFTSNAIWHFFNDGYYDLDYYYCSNCLYEVPNLSKLNRVWPKIAPANNCPSHYTGEIKLTNEQKGALELQFIQATNAYNSASSEYAQLKDGGSTETKVSEINNAYPEQMLTIKENLLSTSPHLSDSVLKALSDKSDVFPDAVIFDVFSVNPDEMKNDKLIKHLENKENPLPQYMIDILKQIAEGNTYKSILQQDMAKHHRAKSNAAMDQIRSILNDTIIGYDSLRTWFSNLGGIKADIQIIETYMHQRNYSNANTLAATLPSLYSLNGKELEEFAMFMSLMELEQDLDTIRTFSDLTETEYALLQSIADSSVGIAGAKAKGIITKYYGGHYNNCITLDSSLYKSSMVSPNILGKDYGLYIACNPNPAKEWAAFDYKLLKDESKGILSLFDGGGKLLFNQELSNNIGQFIWDTRKVEAGQYIYVLHCKGFNISGKIIVIK